MSISTTPETARHPSRFMQDPSRSLAALFVDLENLFLGRAKRGADADADADAVYAFSRDLMTLQRALPDLAQGRRVSVKRAYADYFTGKPVNNQKLNHLRLKVPTLYQFGIEPVHVFRPWSEAKNSVDMRLAVDALTLVDGEPAYDTVVLVSGDGDFVPLVHELKRRGVEVVAVGVSGAAAQTLRKCADHFEFFRDLESKYRDEDLALAIEIVDRLSEKQAETSMGEVRAEFERRMPTGWDPMNYQCPTLHEFLRQFADAFGGEVFRRNGGEYVLRRKTAPKRTQLDSRRELKPHSVADYYRILLANGSSAQIHLVQEGDWERITDSIWDLFLSDTRMEGGHSQNWLKRTVAERLERELPTPVDEKVESVLWQLIHSQCLVGGRVGRSRTRRFGLNPEIKDVEGLRAQNTQWVVRTLVERVQPDERARMDAASIAEMFYGPDVSSGYAEDVDTFLQEALASVGLDDGQRQVNVPAAPRKRALIGEILVARKALEAEQVQELLEWQRQSLDARPLGELAVERGYCAQVDVDAGLVEQRRA